MDCFKVTIKTCINHQYYKVCRMRILIILQSLPSTKRAHHRIHRSRLGSDQRVVDRRDGVQRHKPRLQLANHMVCVLQMAKHRQHTKCLTNFRCFTNALLNTWPTCVQRNSFCFRHSSPPARWGLLDFITVVLLLRLLRLLLLLLPLLQLLLHHLCIHSHVHFRLANSSPSSSPTSARSGHCWTSTARVWAHSPPDRPSELSEHRWTSTHWAPLDLNLGPSELSEHRYAR